MNKCLEENLLGYKENQEEPSEQNNMSGIDNTLNNISSIGSIREEQREEINSFSSVVGYEKTSDNGDHETYKVRNLVQSLNFS